MSGPSDIARDVREREVIRDCVDRLLEPVETEHHEACPMGQSERISTLCMCYELDRADADAYAEEKYDAEKEW